MPETVEQPSALEILERLDRGLCAIMTRVVDWRNDDVMYQEVGR